MGFLEASAKSGHNVQHSFERVTEILLERIETGEIDLKNSPIGIKVGAVQHKFDEDTEVGKKKNKKNSCCK